MIYKRGMALNKLIWYNPIFDSWKSKKTATNLVNMGCVAVFYLASMCAIF